MLPHRISPTVKIIEKRNEELSKKPLLTEVMTLSMPVEKESHMGNGCDQGCQLATPLQSQNKVPARRAPHLRISAFR